MFGQIMEPAFVGDAAARFELVAALNFISRGEVFRGMSKLNKLFAFCSTDDDFAAWYFFMGTCCEKLGFSQRAIVMFTESAKYEPEFYMVYLLLAKCLHEQKHYEPALGAYSHALECFKNKPQTDTLPAVREEPLIGSLHGNMATCLVMMRRYDDAEYELYEAEGFGYSPPLMNLTWAILYAATDRKQLARDKMSVLRDTLPEIEARSVLSVEEILAGKSPRFNLQKLEPEKLDEFWRWFESRQDKMLGGFQGAFGENPFNELNTKLKELFDCKSEQVLFALSRDAGKPCISFFDNYNLTFEIWLERLVDRAPKSVKEKWSFYAVH